MGRFHLLLKKCPASRSFVCSLNWGDICGRKSVHSTAVNAV